eukprot:gene12658-21510_t
MVAARRTDHSHQGHHRAGSLAAVCGRDAPAAPAGAGGDGLVRHDSDAGVRASGLGRAGMGVGGDGELAAVGID